MADEWKKSMIEIKWRHPAGVVPDAKYQPPDASCDSVQGGLVPDASGHDFSTTGLEFQEIWGRIDGPVGPVSLRG